MLSFEYAEGDFSTFNPRKNSETSINVERCNLEMQTNGITLQMFDISNVNVNIEDDEDFWMHHGRSADEWQDGMESVQEILYELSKGVSLSECQGKHPKAYNILFGYDPIRLSVSNGVIDVSGGRHRIKMAQMLNIQYLPVEINYC